MPRPPARLYLDEDVSVVVAAILQARGFDERLHREWQEGGKAHAGIIVARRRPPGELAARVGRLLSRLSADDLESQLLYA